MAAIAILDDYQNVAFKYGDWSRVQRDHKVTVFNKHLGRGDPVAKALQEFDVVCLMRERTAMPREVIEKLPNLKLLITAGMRNASVDMKAAEDCKVTVCGTPAGHQSTAELAMGMIVSLARHIHFESNAMRQGHWQTTVGRDLKGKTLGLLGLGKLGATLAKIGQAFEMRTIAWSQNLTAERAKEVGCELVSKEELFRQSDYVSVHLVLSPRSRGLVGANEFALMKPTASLINTSRGPIVDEAALLAALRAERIGAAAIDVYDTEPLPADHPLRKEKRALLTPHIGYVTEETYRTFYAGMIEAIEGWAAGKPVRVIKP
jgi:D-3-phosphoglycerate dehydrogenase